MTGPTAAISVTVALPGASVLPSLLSVGAPAGVPGSVPTLASFVDLMVDQPQIAPPVVSVPADDRQCDAAPGNSLPDDKEDETTDPALAWLLAAPVAPPPAPVAKAPAAPEIPVAKAVVGVDAKVVPVLPRPVDPRVAAKPGGKPEITPETSPEIGITREILVEPVPADATQLVAADPVEATDAASAEPPAATVPVKTATPVRPDPNAPAPQPRPEISARVMAAAMLRTPQAQPATLARALAANAGAQPALFALAMDRPGEDTEIKPFSATVAGATLLTPTDAAALIARPGEAQRQALDMGQPDWPQKMIDRIETLRDAANANDTSIRLKPEALGRVDVSLKAHADGAVSVRFTAEQPATRTMIADAAPQLQAAAEARGIRLTQTSVDLAGSGQGERQRQQFELQQNRSNRLAASGEADTSAVADGRIA